MDKFQNASILALWPKYEMFRNLHGSESLRRTQITLGTLEDSGIVKMILGDLDSLDNCNRLWGNSVEVLRTLKGT